MALPLGALAIVALVVISGGFLEKSQDTLKEKLSSLSNATEDWLSAIDVRYVSSAISFATCRFTLGRPDECIVASGLGLLLDKDRFFRAAAWYGAAAARWRAPTSHRTMVLGGVALYSYFVKSVFAEQGVGLEWEMKSLHETKFPVELFLPSGLGTVVGMRFKPVFGGTRTCFWNIDVGKDPRWWDEVFMPLVKTDPQLRIETCAQAEASRHYDRCHLESMKECTCAMLGDSRKSVEMQLVGDRELVISTHGKISHVPLPYTFPAATSQGFTVSVHSHASFWLHNSTKGLGVSSRECAIKLSREEYIYTDAAWHPSQDPRWEPAEATNDWITAHNGEFGGRLAVLQGFPCGGLTVGSRTV